MEHDPNMGPEPVRPAGEPPPQPAETGGLTGAEPVESPTWQVLSRTDAGARWAHDATRRAYGTEAGTDGEEDGSPEAPLGS